MKKIAFDLDGTLINFINAFDKQLESYTDGRVKRLEHDKFRMKTEPQITDEDVWMLIKLAYSRLEDMPPFPGARELTNMVYSLTCEPIYIVTRRPISHAHWTHMAIEQFIQVPYKVAFPKTYDKREYLDGYDYFIDDRRKTALELAAWGIEVLIPYREYNVIPIEARPNNLHFYKELTELVKEMPILL